jgi:hypothetical protein
VVDPGARDLAFGSSAAEARIAKDYEASKKEPVYPGLDTPKQVRSLSELSLSVEIVFATNLLLAKHLLEPGLTGGVIGSALGVAVLVTQKTRKSRQTQV